MIIFTPHMTTEQVLTKLVERALASNKYEAVVEDLIAPAINAAVSSAEANDNFEFDYIVIDNQEISLFVDLTDPAQFDADLFDLCYGHLAAEVAVNLRRPPITYYAKLKTEALKPPVLVKQSSELKYLDSPLPPSRVPTYYARKSSSTISDGTSTGLESNRGSSRSLLNPSPLNLEEETVVLPIQTISASIKRGPN